MGVEGKMRCKKRSLRTKRISGGLKLQSQIQEIWTIRAQQISNRIVTYDESGCEESKIKKNLENFFENNFLKKKNLKLFLRFTKLPGGHRQWKRSICSRWQLPPFRQTPSAHGSTVSLQYSPVKPFRHRQRYASLPAAFWHIPRFGQLTDPQSCCSISHCMPVLPAGQTHS